MIVGVFLRYFKTYQGINYIPITDEDKFCGLVGENGIGKSSILEALDSFFNGKAWNFNTVTKRSGLPTTRPHIVPIFLIKKSELIGEILEKAEILNSVSLSINEDAVSPVNKSHLRNFIQHRNQIVSKHNMDDYLLLPIGIDYDGKTAVSIFNSSLLVQGILGEDIPEGKSSES